MFARRGLYPLALALIGLGLAWTWNLGIGPASSDPSPRAEAGHAAPDSWTFRIGSALEIPREGVDERMFALLFEVSAEGTPELADVYLLHGRVPRSRPCRDLSRTYRWRLLDFRGDTLIEGKHTDRLAAYTPSQNGPCQKDELGEHGMLIRTPWHADAVQVQLEIVGETGETIEEHQHR